MSDKENKKSWKINESFKNKDYGSNSPRYDGKRRSDSISSSKSKKFSVSRSRSYSRSRRRDHRKKKSGSKSRERSNSISRSYQVSSERNQQVPINNPNQKRPNLNFLVFIKKAYENYLTNNNLLKKVIFILSYKIILYKFKRLIYFILFLDRRKY